MEKNKPEIDGKLIPGTTENSDFCAPVPFVCKSESWRSI